jgi:prepilin-type N-terminal cleavage/methylation domain-containing protein
MMVWFGNRPIGCFFSAPISLFFPLPRLPIAPPKASIFHCQRGFTLIQLAVTMSIVSLLTVFAVSPLQKWRSTLELNGATRQLSAALHLARMRAITRQETIQCFFSSHGYVLSANGTTESIYALPTGVTLTRENASLVFLSRGTVEEGTQGSLQLSNGGHSQVISVNIAGAIRVGSEV